MKNKRELLKVIIDAVKANFCLRKDKKYLVSTNEDFEGSQDIGMIMIIGLAHFYEIPDSWVVDELGLTLAKTREFKKAVFDKYRSREIDEDLGDDPKLLELLRRKSRFAVKIELCQNYIQNRI